MGDARRGAGRPIAVVTLVGLAQTATVIVQAVLLARLVPVVMVTRFSFVKTIVLLDRPYGIDPLRCSED